MKPSDEEVLLAGLRALREKTAEDAPPAAMEAVVLREFRRRQIRRRKPFLWIGLTAAAALVLMAVLLATRQPVPVERGGAEALAGARPPAGALGPVVTSKRVPDPPVPAPVRMATRRISRPQHQAAPLAEEVATEFLSLPYAPRFTDDDRGQLVRVRLPRESMRSLGLPVNQDRIVEPVKADVLIGEDGIARAIRFVQ